MTRRRVAVIGTGNIAQLHVNGYQAAGADIVALCDTNAEVLAARQADWHVPGGCTTYEELLADASIEAVSICTPNSSHHPITLAAAAAGKHVLVEKPISMQLGEAQEMIDACAEAGVVLQVGHHMRSWAAAAKAKQLIDSGAIGRVMSCRFRQAHDWGGAAKVRGVFGSKALSGGGTLLDNGCHLFDLARYLAGDVQDVFARAATLKWGTEVEDTALVSLAFASGALGSVEVAWTATGWQEAFWIFGSDGSLECDNRTTGAGVLIHRYRESGATNWADTDVTRHELRGHPSHTQHVMNFLAAIAGERDVVCTGSDGLDAVRLVLASYDSAERGTVVPIN